MRFQLLSCSVTILLGLAKLVVDGTNVCVDGGLCCTASFLLDLRCGSLDKRESRLDVRETVISVGIRLLQQWIDWAREFESGLASSLDRLTCVAPKRVRVELVQGVIDKGQRLDMGKELERQTTCTVAYRGSVSICYGSH